jgi:hypothetical protein
LQNEHIYTIPHARRVADFDGQVHATEDAMSKRTSIVFAHGLWADGSCFGKLIPALQAEGHEVMASQHGLDSLAGDVAAVKACLARVSSPAILVGHSYGGTLITHAGTDPRVAGLKQAPGALPKTRRSSDDPHTSTVKWCVPMSGNLASCKPAPWPWRRG